jgi:hypothetical protein
MAQQVLTITQLNEYIRSKLDADTLLNAVAVIAPNTALSNGLGMANMALGGMIPFLGILIWLNRKEGASDGR